MRATLNELPPGFDGRSPTVATTSVERCPICRSPDRSFVAEGRDFEIQTCQNLWNLWQCHDCTAIWLDARPDVSELAVIYPPTYYAYEMSEKLSPVILKGKEILDSLKFSGILKALSSQPRSYLDVGCGDGRYLRLFAKRGVPTNNIFGIELSSPSIPKLRQEGFQVFSERVEDVREIKPGSLDLITMFHVIEHVDEPVTVLRQLASWMSPGGLLAIETPNVDSLDRRIFGKSWWGGYHIPRHWTLFNERSLHRALRDSGLEIVVTRYQTGHSFWLYSFHHALKFNRWMPLPRVARFFDPMHSRVFLAAFTGFDLIRRILGAKTSAMLVLARKP